MEWLKKQLSPEEYSTVMRQMNEIDWKRAHTRIRKIKYKSEISGWDRLPAIKDFKIFLGYWHPMLRLVGIHKRTPSSFEFESSSSSEANRYMTRQLIRLSKLRNNPNGYFKLAWILIKTSSAFRCSAINHVFHNWYKDKSYFFILNVNRKVSKLIKEMRTDLDFKRVYIPKPNGKVRPLGVPTPEWRVLLHMINNFIHWFVLPKLLKSQHGFIPGRGSLTAWKELLGSGKLDQPYIYECDLKNFFNEVSLLGLNRRLARLGFPNWVIEFLYDLNMSSPHLPPKKDWELDESPSEIKSNTNVFNSFMLREFLGIQLGDYGSPKGYYGVPQGAPTSPLLSILILDKFLTQQTSISYADDPIFFGSKDFTIEDSPSEGILISQEKSGWVKREGKWLKPLKFLGLEYDGTALKAKTRNGSVLECKGTYKEMLIAVSEWEKQEGIIDGPTDPEISNSKTRMLHSWKQIFSSTLAGYLQAQLYIGRWDSKVSQDFALKFGTSSWINLHKGKCPPWSTFTVSSYACASLINTIRNGMCIRKVRTGISGVRIRWMPGRPAK